MSNTTPAINTVNKTQPQSAGKAAIAKQETELNFNDLFSSALGNSAPQARLNNIENQLREALLKQEKDKKPVDANQGAEAAQAAVWAQRNWMQNTSMEQNAATPAAKPLEASQPAPAQASTASQEQKEAQSTSSSESGSAEEYQPVKENQATESANQAQANSEAAATANTTPASAAGNTAQSATSVNTSEATNLALSTATQSSETMNMMQQQTLPAELAGSGAAAVQTAELNRAGKATAQAQDATTTGNSIDKLQQSIVSIETEPNSGPANSMRGTNPVAAQLAPQVAQQMQMAGNSGPGEEGLQIGQKIMASGTLQAAGTANGIAAGTNGLNGTLGASQQGVIKTPVNQPGFAKELGQTVQWAIGKNLSTVDIRVNPESFGPMNMRLVQKGQQVQLVIRTQDEASANLLTQALGGLKEVLAQNGLQLNQVQIQHGNSANPQQGFNSNGQANAEQNTGHGRQGNQQGNGGAKTSPEPVVGNSTSPAATPKGKLDLFA